MGARLFLSHSVAEPDRPLLEHIEKECAQLGISLYLAEREFSPTTVTEKLRGAIQSSDCVVVLLTASGTMSAWVNQKIAIANEMSKPIVPLLEENVEAPGMIRERDQIRFSRTMFADAFERVTRYISSLKREPSGDSPVVDYDDLLLGMAIGAAIVAVVVIVILAFSRN
jgi:hypothetical protein